MSSILSVSQLNKYISLKLGSDVKLKGLTVRGELSEFKIHYKSGHAYFVLKDSTSKIKGVMFSRSVQKLGFMPQSGMSLICSGNLEVYEPQGVYQMIATELIPAGIGAKFMQLNALKQKLSEMGVFAEERKKKLPELPKKIAVVTSLNGAALQDVLNIMRRRYPAGEIEIFPAQVQGDTAPATIAAALDKADRSGADVVILTRGGGSFEDLMPFNTEEVALAVSACRTPVISAVGHETDTTLADHAADMRAPTPSAAAELCAPTTEIMLGALDSLKQRLDNSFLQLISDKEDAVGSLSGVITRYDPRAEISRKKDMLDSLCKDMSRSMLAVISRKQNKLENISGSLKALDPLSVLDRGYTITLKNGQPVTGADDIDIGDDIVIRFKDFSAEAKITAITDV
ncbi:MAG: exodeoxyribonuclease VII large subunit [Ruminococcus sp.]|nr:exodeoxyribonuclease VII large subunit [Ruminococcus sp.]